MTSITKTRLLLVVLCAAVMLLAAVPRLVQLATLPVGSDGDAAWIGINALDWVDRGVWPYYVREVYGPEPLSVYLAGLMIPLVGISNVTTRLTTALTGILFCVCLFPAVWWLLPDAPRPFRLRASLIASLAAALSLHAIHVSRNGLQAAHLPLAVTLVTWLTAWAWAKSVPTLNQGNQPKNIPLRFSASLRLCVKDFRIWLLAGAALALTQYIYTAGRIVPLIVVVWFLHSALFQRERFKQQWRGWFVMAAAAFVLVLPNILLFIQTPAAFTSRADAAGEYTGGLIWHYDLSDRGGVVGLVAEKLVNNLRAVGIFWDHPYTSGIKQPILSPLFFAGFLITVWYLVRKFRQPAYAWLWLALPVALIPDLISSISSRPHAMRQIAALPFIFMLAGIGLAHVWGWVEPLISNRPIRALAGAGLALLMFVPTAQQWAQYRALTDDQYDDPDTSWLHEQADLDMSRRIVREPDTSYLVLATEYDRPSLAWHTAGAFRNRHSALDSTGNLAIANAPGRVSVVMPDDPYRVRRDSQPAQMDTRLWVLMHDGQTYLLPPLTAGGEQWLLDAMANAEPDALMDRSDTEIAQFYSLDLPDDFWRDDFAPIAPVNARFNDQIELAGYELTSTDLVPGETFFVTLYWHALTSPPEDYEIFVQLWTDNGTSIASWQNVPYSGMYRTRIWRPDELVPTHHWLTLPEDAAPGRYHLVAGLFRTLQGTRLPASGENANEDGDYAVVANLRVPLPPAERGRPPAESIAFGDTLALSGLDVTVDGEARDLNEPLSVAPGQTLQFALTWDALAAQPLDYSLFVHLTPDADSPPAAQFDGTIGGTYPTGIWQPGDVIADNATLTIPSDLPPGEYSLWIGVYYWQTGSRLPALLDGDPQADDRLLLARVRVG